MLAGCFLALEVQTPFIKGERSSLQLCIQVIGALIILSYMFVSVFSLKFRVRFHYFTN